MRFKDERQRGKECFVFTLKKKAGSGQVEMVTAQGEKSGSGTISVRPACSAGTQVRHADPLMRREDSIDTASI